MHSVKMCWYAYVWFCENCRFFATSVRPVLGYLWKVTLPFLQTTHMCMNPELSIRLSHIMRMHTQTQDTHFHLSPVQMCGRRRRRSSLCRSQLYYLYTRRDVVTPYNATRRGRRVGGWMYGCDAERHTGSFHWCVKIRFECILYKEDLPKKKHFHLHHASHNGIGNRLHVFNIRKKITHRTSFAL